MERYEDIIFLHRPISQRHGKMTSIERAKQFDPFAALKGFESAIDYQNRTLIPKPILSEEAIESINQTLQMVHRGDEVEVTYFRDDVDVPGYGDFQVVSGTVCSIKIVDGLLIIENQKILLRSIQHLKINSGL